MVVTTPDNYGRTRARRFTIQGVKARHRRMAERIAPGEDPKPIWVSTGRPDPYPWRFRIARGVVRDADDAIPAAALVDRLAFTCRWPRAHWRLAFQGNLHEIGRRDFAVIERALAS